MAVSAAVTAISSALNRLTILLISHHAGYGCADNGENNKGRNNGTHEKHLLSAALSADDVAFAFGISLFL